MWQTFKDNLKTLNRFVEFIKNIQLNALLIIENINRWIHVKKVRKDFFM